MNVRSELYIDGKWQVAHGEEQQVVNPATENVDGAVQTASSEDVDLAVQAAGSAMEGWRTTPPDERAAHLFNLAQVLRERQEELAALVTLEMGAANRTAMGIHTALPIAVLESMKEVASSYPFEREVANSLVRKVPFGPVATITPWNFPIHQIVAKIGPALLAGCTAVVKPSIEAPLSAYLLAEAVDAAGLPPGVFNLVTGRGREVGSQLVDHPGIAAVSFTGSTEAGRRIYKVAAERIRPVTLELGGKSASVILPDAELSVAVKVSVANAFLNAGQTCSAWTRMVVPEERRDDVIDLVRQSVDKHAVGDPTDPTTRVGPLVSLSQLQTVRGLVDRAVNEGSKLIAGGSEPPEGFEKGFYFRPTALIDVARDQEIAQEEVFGPVLVIQTYSDEAEAEAIANDSAYGLAGAVWSADDDRAERFATRMETGQVDVNGGKFNVLAPFGGFKSSGIGREFGTEGVDAFVQAQAIQR